MPNELIQGICEGAIPKIVRGWAERDGAGIFRGTVVRLEKDISLKEQILRDNLWNKTKVFAVGILMLFIIAGGESSLPPKQHCGKLPMTE